MDLGKKIKKVITFVLASVVFMTACTNPIQVNKKQAMDNITYIKDGKTNLCFAILGSIGDSGFVKQSISYVPCTPEVLEQANKAKE